MGLKPKWNPHWTPTDRPKQLDGRFATDIVDAAQAIANDEWVKKHKRNDRRHSKKVRLAAITLPKAPWED